MLQGGVINVVQESFELVRSNSNRFTRVFFDRLFELQPKIKKEFSKDIRDQRRRFFKTIELAVYHIDEVPLVMEKIGKIRFWPAIYNAQRDGQSLFFSTLIYTLSAALGNEFTPYVRYCWVEFLGHLDQVLKEAEDDAVITPADTAKFASREVEALSQ